MLSSYKYSRKDIKFSSMILELLKKIKISFLFFQLYGAVRYRHIMRASHMQRTWSNPGGLETVA
jgi:hypothetical protein